MFRVAGLNGWQLALLAAGGILVVLGMRAPAPETGPRKIVEQFADALRSGDREAAVRLFANPPPDAGPLEPSATRATGPMPSDRAPEAWVPSTTLRCAIQKLQQGPHTAIADCRLIDAGYSTTCRILLERQANGTWHIGRIENLQPDPRLAAAERRARQQANEQLAEDLETALRNSPHVIAAEPSSAERR